LIDIEGSNGLDKGPRTIEVIHSYSSPRKGWCQELMTMFLVDWLVHYQDSAGRNCFFVIIIMRTGQFHMNVSRYLVLCY